MLFRYKATTPEGDIREGELEAASMDIAVGALQKRNLIVVSLDPLGQESSFLKRNFGGQSDLFAKRIKRRDIVIFSRQISTLFEAKVPVATSFKLLAEESENPALRAKLSAVVEDIEGGESISQAMSKHPKLFSAFYVNMVLAGEESGKLDEVFLYLADYLERAYELTSKATKALVYPAFVVSAFIAVMILMLVFVIPKMASIIEESGQEAPIYTKVVMGLSSFFVHYGIFFIVALAIGIIFFWRYLRTESGKMMFSRFQISAPGIGMLYKKLYVSRVADNMETLITGGVSVVKSLEITANVVENRVYKQILEEAVEAIKGGANISESLSKYEEIPALVTQMIKIGEETGKLNYILNTLAKFYRREVDEALETLVGLIEPAMIVVLGAGVGVLLASVLIPIYNIALSV
ncbi:type II secretion system F family protein [Patescibacteria group bacterium]